MKRITRDIAALAVGIAMAAPAGAVDVVGGRPEDVEALKHISTVWIDTYLSGNLDGFMSIIADDVVIMAENQPTQTGKAAAREYVAGRIGRPVADAQGHG